ncbi:hypothetical protein GCM10011391_19590 [Pullulanibacillus camelliae]|uniref:DUF4879 domain-containing protein n=1 Tax=Pullulanibacillus camelliae TaxID=1707096 RepID=A0A8J2VUV0_9BACL|nr:DUF4879 domain-containing protein [Pullulanibacillus camelliae]GGE40896.1 hypothetical protein GCM10011391_19590 [Pullulanibacillus camelliae]
MKRIVVSFIAILLALPVVFTISEKAHAAPAPELTNLQVIGVTSDGVNGEWENIDFNQQSANIPMSGQNGYIAVYIEGTVQNGTFQVYDNGNNITSRTFQALPDDYVTNANNIVIGTIKYIGVPLSEVTSGIFNVTANNYYPPNNTLYDNLFITVN